MRISHLKYLTPLFVIITGIFVLADITDAQELGLFRLKRWNGSMILRMQREKKKSPEISKKHGYSGRFVIRNSGYMINPNVLYFDLSGDVGLFLQQRISQYEHNNTRGRLLGHDLTASFFKSSMNSFIFFWNHNTNVITMEDNGRTGYDVNTIKGILIMRGSKFPSRLDVEWRDVSETWDRVGFKTNRAQLSRSIQYEGEHENNNSKLRVEYDFRDIRDRDRNNHALGIEYNLKNVHDGDSTKIVYNTYSYSRHTANILRQYNFGKNQINHWDSRFNLYIRNGFGNYKNGTLNQSLFLQHFSSLSSQYTHTLSINHSTGTGTTFRNSVFAALRHRLYASLNTNLGVAGTYSTLQDGKIYNYSVNGGISYNKKIPLSGSILLSYSRGYSINDNQIEQTEKVVVSERHVFLGSLPVMLSERNIIVSSIIVRDKSSELIFEQGEDKDYTIRVIGEHVEIHRNVFGRIREGEVILIDYHYETFPAMRYSTDSKIFSAGINFNWLAFNYTINRHAQQLLGGDPIYEDNLQDLYTKTLQMKINLRGEHAGLSLTVDNRNYKSKTLDFNSVNARYAIFVRPWSSLTLSNNFTLSLINHHREKAVIKVYALRSELNWRPSGAFLFQVYGRYRTRKESLRLEESSFEYGGLLQRFWRIFRILLRYENRKWEIIPQHINERRFTIELERVFY